MSISSRQKQILNMLEERAYITVKQLAEMMYTSESSIRRDLAFLQANGLVKRTHGGVSAIEPIKNVASFYDRSRKNVKEMRAIAQIAARFLKNGQSILLDSSTTATFLLPYIAKLKEVTLFTNNLSTAMSAIELGIHTHCLGGHSVGGGVALSGTETFRALSEISADIVFFSSQSLSKDGIISDSTEEENYVRSLMLSRAETKVFLCDSSKFSKTSTYKLCTLEVVDEIVFDRPFDDLNVNGRY